MKRADIHTNDLLFWSDSTNWDQIGSYGFGGQPVVVLDSRRYYVKPSGYYSYGRNQGPQLDPKGTGVLVAFFRSSYPFTGDIQVEERVVRTTELRGDWFEISADHEKRKAAAETYRAQKDAERNAARHRVTSAAHALSQLGIKGVGVDTRAAYAMRVTLEPEAAEEIARLLESLQVHV